MNWQWRHSIKQQGRRVAHRFERWRYPQVFAGQLSDEQAGLWIAEAIRDQRPVLVGRLGSVEARLLAEAQRAGAVPFSRVSLQEAHRNAGIFPVESGALRGVAARLQSALERVDLLALWDSPHQAALVAGLEPMPQRCSLPALEPWWCAQPWSGALAGKRVLVVHPFARSIEQQWSRREQLFANPAVLPAFELMTVEPPQTLAGATQGYASWEEALDQLQQQVAALRFDVALLGCGAYGLPLAAAIADSGRLAIHVGGALQLLFGIRGRRWEASPRFEQLMNSSWVRPSLAETPTGADQVDGRCYW